MIRMTTAAAAATATGSSTRMRVATTSSYATRIMGSSFAPSLILNQRSTNVGRRTFASGNISSTTLSSPSPSSLASPSLASPSPSLADVSQTATITLATSPDTAPNTSASASTTPSVDDTIDKLFVNHEMSSTAATAATDGAGAAYAVWDPTWYNVADQAVLGINMFRDVTGFGYAEAIVGVTLLVRLGLFPLFVKLQRNTARMAHMQPEMMALKAKLETLGTNVDQETQIKYGMQMRALFKKYDCNPLSSLVAPLVQMPVFMGMFFGLRKMPEYDFAIPMSTEGLAWFSDLTAADPYYILPVASATTMLLSVELNKHQMMASNPAQGRIFVNAFRALSIVMVPAIAQFPASLNLYWCINNTVTAFQAYLFQTKAVRKALGIWEMPPPVPGMPQAKGIVESIQDAVQPKPTPQQMIQEHNRSVENKKKIVTDYGHHHNHDTAAAAAATALYSNSDTDATSSSNTTTTSSYRGRPKRFRRATPKTTRRTR